MQEIIARSLSYARGIWRYRWPAIGLAWLICVAGWIFVSLMPDRYEASARVFVDTQSILKPLLSGLAVQPNLDQQIAMMSRTLITRPNLDKVVRMADLDIAARTTADKEGIIDMIAERIQLRGTGKDNLFALAYWDRNAQQAKKVVQSLLTIFVESSLGDKRKDSDVARRFLDEQIKVYEQKLVVAENMLKDFKRRNMGVMPNDKQDYYSRLTEAADRLKQSELELRETENARDALKAQIVGEEPMLLPDEDWARNVPGTTGKDIRTLNPELHARIEALGQNLDQLRLKYTEQHPDIIATKRILAQLDQQKEKELQEVTVAEEIEQARQAGQSKLAEGNQDRIGITAKRQNANPVFQQLKMQLSSTEAIVASIKARVNEFENRFNALKAMANKVPQVEAELTQLNRDYEVNKANYEKLLARRESAQISSEMEQTGEGLDFRIIDPPRVPLAPSGPDRPFLLSLVLITGVLGGLAFAFALSQIRPTFYDRQGLREFSGLPLLGAVTLIWTPEQKRKAWRGKLSYALGCVALIGAYGVVMGTTLIRMEDLLAKVRGLVTF